MNDLSTKLAYSIPELADACGVSHNMIRDAIKNHELVRRYIGSKPIVLAVDAEDWLDHLATEVK